MAMPTSRHQQRPINQMRVRQPDPEPLPINQENWMALGACSGLDPCYELFFPENRTNEGKAKAICSACPVAWECVDFAIRTVEIWGIWGGMTFPERCDLTNKYQGHTSSAARAAHRRHITELNRKAQINARRNQRKRQGR